MRLSAALLATLSLLWASPALADKTCCNTSTGEWVEASTDRACARKPGHVPYTPENTAAVMVCFQATQDMAQDAMQQLTGGGGYSLPSGALPDMSGLGGGQMPDLSAMMGGGEVEPPQCCDTSAGTWAGAMPPEACAAQDGHVPDTPENLAATEVCRPAVSGVWSVDDYEENIPNGGMERWRDEHRPEGFTTFGVAPEMQQSADALDLQTVFRSSDAHTGESSVQLKNYDMRAEIVRREPQAAAYLPPVMGTPGGITSCTEPCPTETGQAVAGSGEAAAAKVVGSLPVGEAKSHVCAAYKGFISPLDQVVFTTVLVKGDALVGGTNTNAPAARITRSAADWVEFALPVHTMQGELGDVDKVGIQVATMPRGALGMSPASVSSDTDVKVDSVHFCDLMEFSIHHPLVISEGQERVPDDEEDSAGAQTFVNLDNDDKDGFFDHEDKDGVGDEDELVKLTMRLPLDSRGEVSLKVSGRPDVVKLWHDRGKLTPFTDANKELDVGDFMALSEDGLMLERVVWVEGVKPSHKPGDVVFDFRFDNARAKDDPFEDKVVLTVLAIEELHWKGKGNSVNDDEHLDADPNWPGAPFPGDALRVFPGKRWDSGEPSSDRFDLVIAQVTLNVAPVRPVTLYLRAFDVDDPSAEADEVDREDRAEDNRGEAPHRWGGFPSTAEEVAPLEFTEQVAELELRVTLQPGDNFRLVGSGDEQFLRQLTNDDVKLAEAGPRHTTTIVDRHVLEARGKVGLAKVPEEEAAVSDVLTVWRKLYLEIDQMELVTDNSHTTTIVDHRPAGATQGPDGQPWRQEWLILDINLYDALPEESKSGRAGYVDNFKGGRLLLDGVGYQVQESTAKGSGDDEVLVAYPASWGEWPDGDNGKTVVLTDDDATKDGDPVPALQTQRIAPAFAPAYVLPVFDEAPNPNPTVAFRLHFKSDQQSYLQGVFAEGFHNQDHDGDPAIWIAYVLNAFQGKLDEDGDKEPGLMGQASGHPQTGLGGYGVVVFQESGREAAAAYAAEGFGTGWQMPDVAPHELGHLCGGQHEGEGLMSYADKKGVDFEPVTLDRIRACEQP